jgi:hypothetical protein
MRGRKRPKPAPGCSGKAKVDIWATHPYTTGGPTHSAPGPDDVSLGDLRQMTALLRAADRAGKIQNSSARTPFWVTEFSWDTKPPDRGGVPTKLHALWMAEAFYRMYKAGVDTVFWFQIRDEARDGRPDAELYQSGLYSRGGSVAADKPKRALKVFKFPFVALRKGTKRFTFWGRTPKSKRGPVRIQLKNGRGGFVTVKKVSANKDGIFEGTVARRGLRRSGKVRAKVAGQGTSLPFVFTFRRDCYQPPFGGPKSQCS